MDLVGFFMSPKVVLILFTLFLVGYIIFIDLEGGFSQQFLHFGPGTTPETTTKFLGIVLDSWSKVIILYVVGFFASLMTTYYRSIMGNNIHSYIWNRAIKHVPYSKTWTYLTVMMEPFFFQILEIVQFFTNLTMQLQFIIPQFVGSFIADVPFTIRLLGNKTFAEL